MKIKVTRIFRLGAVAMVAGAFCVSQAASAQSKAPDAPDDAPPVAKTSMAPIGQKPSKAELAKQKAEEEAAGGTTATATKATGATTGNAAKLPDVDRQFIVMALKDNMKEAHMGQMAVQNGQSDQVKKLGARIASDHTKANQQLLAIATKKGVTPDTRATDHKMSKRDMKNFDQAWTAMMINDHQKGIALYQRQVQQGGDADLKNYAKKTLPILQKHLKMVQQAQQKIGSGDAASEATTKR